MNHRESAELLAQVIPLMERPKCWLTSLSGVSASSSGVWAWLLVDGGGVRVSHSGVVDVWRVEGNRAESRVENKWEITTSVEIVRSDADRASLIAAVRLAVSRLYDGPQDAPVQPVAISSKPALCNERGCSQDRTVGMLCASHARRAEVYKREQWAAFRAREWDRYDAIQGQPVSRSIRTLEEQKDALRAGGVKPSSKDITFEPMLVLGQSIQASGGDGADSAAALSLPFTLHPAFGLPADADPMQGMRAANASLLLAWTSKTGRSTAPTVEPCAKMVDGVLVMKPHDRDRFDISSYVHWPRSELSGVDAVIQAADADRLPCTTPKCRGHLDASAREHCQRRAGVK